MQNLIPWSEDVNNTWFTPGATVTVTPNAAASPNGEITATRVQWTAGATRYCSPSGQVFKKGVYTISMWVRAVSGTQLFQMRLPLVPGVSNQDSGNYTATTEWKRFSFTAMVNGAGTFTSVYFINDNVNATDVYIWGMQLSQTNGACEYVRTTSLAIDDRAPRAYSDDFGAAANGQNFFLQSENLALTWTPSACSAGTGPDFDGATTNCALVEDGTNAGHYFSQTPVSAGQKSRILVASCIAKAGTRNYLGIAPAGAGVQATFDLTTGVGTWNQNSGVNAAHRLGFGAINYGNGWWYCYVIYRQDTAATAVRFYAGNSTTAASAYAGVNGNKAIYISRMQLAESNGPSVYAKTTTTAVLGKSQRGMPIQNLVPTYINDAFWSPNGISAVTADPTPTPWGTTAYRLIENGGNSAHAVQATGANYVVGRIQSMRVRLKAGTRTWAIVGIGGGGIAAWINLATGAFGTINSFIDKKIEPVGDGWYEITLSAISPNAGGPTVYATTSDGVAVYVGDGSSYIRVAEVQMIEGRSSGSELITKHYGRAPRSLARSWNYILSSEGMHTDTTNWISIGSVVRAASAFPAPNGTMTASNISDTSAAEYRGIFQSRSILKDKRSWCFSLYVRGGSTTPVFGINFSLGGGTAVASSYRFDPTTGQFSDGSLRSGVERVTGTDGSTWYRIWMVLRNNGTNNACQPSIYAATSTSIGAGDSVVGQGNVDIWGAMLNEGEAPVEYVTSTNPSIPVPGTPKRKIIEMEQLVSGTRPSDLTNGNVTSVNSVTAPTGTVAQKVTENTANGAHYVQGTLQVLRKNCVVTMSCVVKYGSGRTWFALGGNSGNSTSFFDIAGGALGNAGANLYGKPTIRPLGDGWYLCSHSYFLDTTTPLANFYICSANGVAVYSGDGASYVYISDIQVTYSSGPPSGRSVWPFAQSLSQGRSPRGLISVSKPDDQLVDYSTYSVGTPFTAGTLPRGGTYTQAAGTNQTEETVQTSATAVSRWAFVANLPRIGLLADGSTGLVLEPPRTNILLRSDAFNDAQWTKYPVITINANATASPTGTVDAETATGSDGNGYISNQNNVTPAVQTYYGTAWLKADVSRTLGIWVVDASDGAPGIAREWTIGTSWGRYGQTCDFDATTPSVGLFIGVNTRFAVGGTYSLWGAQAEKGKYATNWIPTAATTAARSGFGTSFPLSRYVRSGVFRAVLTTVPFGASNEYDNDSATIRLWTIDANTYAELNTTTQILTVAVNGVLRVATVPVWWLKGHRVQWSWEVGGGALRVRYRYSTNLGVNWTLPFDPFGGTSYTDAVINTSSSSIHFYSDSGSSKWFGTGVISEQPVLTAPAWAMQLLPSDDASVKAFFRMDGRYTLASGAYSDLAGHTATAVTPFTQGTANFRPLYNATGFGTARPSADFDGANDYLEAGPLSEWITNSAGAVYVLVYPLAATTNNAPNYNNTPIWQNIGAYAGFSIKTGPNMGGFNYDGTYDDATQGSSLAIQIVRWRHAGGNVYMKVDANESAGTASGNTQIMTGNNRIGGNPGAVGSYLQGRIGAIVATNTDPSTQTDATIMSFLKAYGGL